MKKHNLWKIIITKNPKFVEGNITLTANGLKKLFDTAFDEGEKHGYKTGLDIGMKIEKTHRKFTDIFNM